MKIQTDEPDSGSGMRRIRRSLLLMPLAILVFLFASAEVCTIYRFNLPVPLTGEYSSGKIVTKAQSLNGVTVTASAKTYGWEICYPAFAEPELDWAWEMTTQENRDGESAVAWVSGGGDYLMGNEAALGCFWAHKLKYEAYRHWKSAKGDFGNNGQAENELCTDIYTGEPLPCIP